MNANELAQEFEEYLKQIEELPWGNHQILCDQAATMLRQQADLIRNLQKSLGFKNSGYETINLTPSKELTDEEIIDCVNKEFDLELKDGNATVLAFARAILRKASEK